MSRLLPLFGLSFFLYASSLFAQDSPHDEDKEQPLISSSETNSEDIPEQEKVIADPEPDASPKQNPPPSATTGAENPTVHTSETKREEQPTGESNVDASPQSELAKAPPATSRAVEKDWGQDRVLGGHQFPVATFVPLALSSSYLGVRAGIEYHSVPGFATLTTIGPVPTSNRVDLETVNVAESVDFSLRLHDYVALSGDAYGRGRVGANIETLLGTGADYTYGGDIGALVKIVRIGSLQLAVRGQIGLYEGQSAGVLALFQDLSTIATDALSRLLSAPSMDLDTAIAQLNKSFDAATADLLMPFDGIAYGVSLNMALAIGKYIGLQGSLGYSLDTTTFNPAKFDPDLGLSVRLENTEKTIRPSASAAVDFDSSPIGLPIDIIVEYRFTPISVERQNEEGLSTESSIESLIALGVYYSGRTDLQLGVTGYTLLGQAPALGVNGEPSDKPLDVGVQLVFRYFW